MTLIRKISYGLLIGAAATFVGCTDVMDEIAENPNSPTTVQSDWFLTNAEKQLMDAYWDEWINGRQGMLYPQYWSETSYTEESRYQIRESVNRSFWNDFYTAMQDLETAADLAQDEPENARANKIAILSIMKVWAMHTVTDMYGNVPYSKALQADIVAPAYDDQSAIYAGLISDLQIAIDTIDVSQPGFTSGDVIYNGDPAMWKKFGASLLTRIAVRLSDKDMSLAGTAASAALDAGVFTSNADNALFYYQAASPNNNPLNENNKTRQDFCLSATMVDFMTANADPRLPIYADPAVSTGTYVGLEYGLTNDEATAIPNSDVSMPGAAVLAATAPGVFLDYAEVSFNLAELAERGIISEDAATHYNNGVLASMDYWGVDATEAQTYLTAHPYNSANYINVIGTEKWLGLYMNGTQAWYEVTRMKFTQLDGSPLLLFPAGGSMDPNITENNFPPARMTYISDEYSLNLDNVSAAVSEQGADTKATRLWWDIR